MRSSSGSSASDDRIDDIVEAVLTMARDQRVGESVWSPLEALSGRWREPFARAAVVGEVSVGKSTLVNALVGQDLLPAATEALSSVTVELRYGKDTQALVGVHDGREVVTRDLADREEILTYLTTRGEETVALRHGREARVLWAGVALPSELLAAGLRLTDTPGVGGLNPAHRRQTLTALSNTDAVLFVIRPGKPISASELRFLAESVHRVSSYVIVQTHRDQTSDAQNRLDKNLAVLRDPETWRKLLGEGTDAEAVARRFADVPGVCVSAKLALDALTAAPGPARDRNLTFSGVPELTERLRKEVVDRAGELHRQDLLRLTGSTATAVRARLVERRALLGKGEAAEQAIRAREENVQRWIRMGGDTWRTDLDAATGYVQEEVRTLAGERVELLESTYLDAFTTMRPQRMEEAVKELATEADTAVAEMRELVGRRLNDTVARIVARNPEDEVSAHLQRLTLTEGLSTHLPTGFGKSLLNLDETYLTSVAMTGIPALARQLAEARDKHQRKDGPGPYQPSVLAHLAKAAAVAATTNPVVVSVMAAAVLFAGVAALRKLKARTLKAAREVYDQVTKAITGEAAEHAVELAGRERDAIVEVIEARLREDQESIDRDRQDLADSTGLTPAERAALLNGIDLSVRKLDELIAGLTEVRAEWGL
ncbi:dynamin family protein [Streptomyces sp. JNUCC 64]